MKAAYKEVINRLVEEGFSAYFQGQRVLSEITSTTCMVFAMEDGSYFVVVTFMQKDGLPKAHETEIGFDQVKKFRKEANKKGTDHEHFYIDLTNGQTITIKIYSKSNTGNVEDFLKTYAIIDDNKFKKERDTEKLVNEVVINQEAVSRKLEKKAILLYDIGLYDDALEVFQEAVQYDRTNEEAEFGLAKVSIKLGLQERANIHLEKCIKLKPSEEKRFKWELAQIFADAGQFDEAINQSTAILEKDDTEDWYCKVVYYLFQANKDEQALELIKQNISTKSTLFKTAIALDLIPIEKRKWLEQQEMEIVLFLIKVNMPVVGDERAAIIKAVNIPSQISALEDWGKSKIELKQAASLEIALDKAKHFQTKNMELTRAAIQTICNQNNPTIERLGNYPKILELAIRNSYDKEVAAAVKGYKETFEAVKKTLDGYDLDSVRNILEDKKGTLSQLWGGESMMENLLSEKVSKLNKKRSFATATNLINKLVILFPENESFKTLKVAITKKRDKRIYIISSIILIALASFLGYCQYKANSDEKVALSEALKANNLDLFYMNTYFEKYPKGKYKEVADDSLWNRILYFENLRRTWVGGLRVREEPFEDKEVLESLQEFGVVTLLGEQSELKSTIRLRRKNYTAHWVKIRSESGIEGWVFGGGLKHHPTYKSYLNQYKTFLSDGKNIKKAEEKLSNIPD